MEKFPHVSLWIYLMVPHLSSLYSILILNKLLFLIQKVSFLKIGISKKGVLFLNERAFLRDLFIEHQNFPYPGLVSGLNNKLHDLRYLMEHHKNWNKDFRSF